jgi:hypothetical protein
MITICSDGKDVINQQAMWSGYIVGTPASILELMKDLQGFLNLLEQQSDKTIGYGNLASIRKSTKVKRNSIPLEYSPDPEVRIKQLKNIIDQSLEELGELQKPKNKLFLNHKKNDSKR